MKWIKEAWADGSGFVIDLGESIGGKPALAEVNADEAVELMQELYESLGRGEKIIFLQWLESKYGISVGNTT